MFYEDLSQFIEEKGVAMQTDYTVRIIADVFRQNVEKWFEIECVSLGAGKFKIVPRGRGGISIGFETRSNDCPLEFVETD